jgi:Copper amine oxidase, enzyme domain
MCVQREWLILMYCDSSGLRMHRVAHGGRACARLWLQLPWPSTSVVLMLVCITCKPFHNVTRCARWQAPREDGLVKWTKRDRRLVDEDVVLWHIFAAHHVPR